MLIDKSGRPLRLLARGLTRPYSDVQSRTFSASRTHQAEVEITATSSEAHPPYTSTRTYDPNTVHTSRYERRLQRRQHVSPIGSRRRRAAIQYLKVQKIESLPFEQMPYQCFQEARKYLQEDRKQKIGQISQQRERIERVRSSQTDAQNAASTEKLLSDMDRRLSTLKIWADINDPVVKKRFEDGLGDMDKPIYRHLAEQEWRSYKYRLLTQRIEQMRIVPDVLPALDPTIATNLSFRSRNVQPGEVVDSRVSEGSPKLKLQCFEKGERLVTIAVVNPDVPNVETDGFNYRGHFLACNIRISPSSGNVDFGKLEPEKILLNWHPAYAQKGAPYQRLAVVVLEQVNGEIDTAKIKETGKITERRKLARDGFILRRMVDFYGLKAVGATLFRTQWDEGTAGVMQRAGVPGWNVEFKRKRVEPLPYKKLSGDRYR
ncbi:PEBP-like protein [Polychaeton citri CBS 116435]|uniref:Large ribosomal subunit protein mL38 n=1 Tax=Polychaeton citri CBS 116435 TaxID=1314669 RepID=A0A9P4Q5V0_9PEZI|nr:PEBP-like protein [Polychaeton citri CBS 116435]